MGRGGSQCNQSSSAAVGGRPFHSCCTCHDSPFSTLLLAPCVRCEKRVLPDLPTSRNIIVAPLCIMGSSMTYATERPDRDFMEHLGAKQRNPALHVLYVTFFRATPLPTGWSFTLSLFINEGSPRSNVIILRRGRPLK